MTKYFATDAHTFESFNLKVKSGQILDITDDLATSLNGIFPGTLVRYEPEVHMPAPVVQPVVAKQEISEDESDTAEVIE